MNKIMKLNRKLILEKAFELKDDELKSEYQDIYKKKFNRMLSDKELKNQMKKDHLIIDKVNNKPTSIMRYGLRKNDSYSKFFKINNYVSLSDLASVKKGAGAKNMKYLIKKSDDPIILVPWNDSLIKYYNKFGFKEYHPKDKKYPKTLMIKENKK